MIGDLKLESWKGLLEFLLLVTTRVGVRTISTRVASMYYELVCIPGTQQLDTAHCGGATFALCILGMDKI